MAYPSVCFLAECVCALRLYFFIMNVVPSVQELAVVVVSELQYSVGSCQLVGEFLV